MSFCPTNDIHSVYLDNELPEQFKIEYEEHIKNCPQCQKKLEKLRAVHNLFVCDSKSISPDSHYLDESFERLKIKMSYSKTSGHTRPRLQIKNWGYVAMAAAAVFAFAFIVPLHLSDGKQSSNVASLSVPFINSANNVSFDSGRSVVISGNIGGTVLSSVKGVGSSSVASSVARGISVSTGSGMSNGSVYARHQQSNQDMMRSVEVLHPNFADDQTISIKITFPGMYDGPFSPEMPVPEIVITGRFE